MLAIFTKHMIYLEIGAGCGNGYLARNACYICELTLLDGALLPVAPL